MQLGYLAFEVENLSQWHNLLTQVIGLVDVGDGRYRMDQYAWRIQIIEGDADDLRTVAWELTAADLEETLQRLRTAQWPVVERDASAIGATQRWALKDPAGTDTELVVGLPKGNTPFHSPVVPNGFVADDLGMGHLVLTAPDKQASADFYQNLLGFALSDHIVTQVFGHPVDLSFFHANARHHSLALGGPLRKRLHHLMFEARRFDDVGLAYDRAIRAGVPIMQTLGRHPNDKMFSFYAKTPSKFQFEFGWGGRMIDDADWEPTTYDHISEWGHHPPQVVLGSRK